MVLVFDNTSDLVNSMVKINSSWIKITDGKLNKLPISCKYFLTLFDLSTDTEINKLFSYITDETRTNEFPFVKDNHIDYSLMLEIEQFYNIDLNGNLTIKDISNDIDRFIDIVNESNGKIAFVLDICFLLNFMVQTKNQSKPNHLIDMIMFKLSNLSKLTNSNIPNVSEIFVLDRQNIITNPKNLFYLQLENCLKKNNNIYGEIYVHIYKSIEESVVENVYWNVLDPCVKITEHMGRIKSPYDDNSYFNLVKINNSDYFVKKISINDCIDKNLFDLDNNPGIIIEPIDRLNI